MARIARMKERDRPVIRNAAVELYEQAPLDYAGCNPPAHTLKPQQRPRPGAAV